MSTETDDTTTGTAPPSDSDLVPFADLRPGDAFEYWPFVNGRPFGDGGRLPSRLGDGRVSRYIKTREGHPNADAKGGCAIDILDGMYAVFQSDDLVLPKPVASLDDERAYDAGCDV